MRYFEDTNRINNKVEKLYNHCHAITEAGNVQKVFKELQLWKEPDNNQNAVQLYKLMVSDYDQKDYEPTMLTAEESVIKGLWLEKSVYWARIYKAAYQANSRDRSK